MIEAMGERLFASVAAFTRAFSSGGMLMPYGGSYFGAESFMASVCRIGA